MKRHFGKLVALCIAILTIGIQQASAQTADEIIANFLERYPSIESDGETLVVYADDVTVEVEIDGDTVEGTIYVDFSVNNNDGTAEGQIRLDLDTGQTLTYEVTEGQFELGDDDTVESFHLSLTTPDGDSATADGSSLTGACKIIVRPKGR